MRSRKVLPALLLLACVARAQQPALEVPEHDARPAPSVRIVAPTPHDIPLGPTKIEVAPEHFERGDVIEVFADGRKVGALTSPPWTLPWDAGEAPRPHVLRAVIRRDGTEVATGRTRTQDTGYSSSVTSRAVSLSPLVIDGSGRPVHGLSRPEFTVLDDGVAQTIETFDSGETPLSVILAFDVSGSMTLKMSEARAAAHRFLDALKPDDQVSLLFFSSSIVGNHPFTKDRSSLHAALDAARPSGETALYDATAAALQRLKALKHRKAVVLFTDGEDNRSRFGVDHVIEMARASEVSIYSIAQGQDESKVLRVYLDRLADETGGRSFFIGQVKTLPGVFDEIVSELKNQYFLTYTPKPSEKGAWHRVDVKVSRPGLKVRAKRGYVVD